MLGNIRCCSWHNRAGDCLWLIEDKEKKCCVVMDLSAFDVN